MDETNELDSRLIEPERVLEDDDDDKNLVKRVWEENKLIWRTALPAILFRLSMSGVQLVTQSFVGRISQVDLAAYSIVLNITVRFATAVLIGMSSATETLCGQAFGAKHYRVMGIYLQRSWIINLVTTTLMLPLYLFSDSIYKLLGQDAKIADATEGIVFWFIGDLYAFVFSVTTESFLQAQRKNMLIGLVSPLTFIFHVLISWIFVSKLSWGIVGAMGAFVISRWIFNVFLHAYTFGGWCSETWTGFSMEAFHDLIHIVKLSISSGVMLCLQQWYCSILVLLAGYTSNAIVNIDAFSVCISINLWQNMICLGFMGATCVRVANELGRGNIKAAKFSIKLILITSLAFGVVFCVLCLVFDKEIPYLFTTNDEVAEATSNLFFYLIITMMLNSFQTVLSGVAIGTGLQTKVAFVNIISYYIIGIPIGCILAYVADYGVVGIWLGLISGVVVQAIFMAYVSLKIDWANEVNRTTQRLNKYNLKRDQEINENSSNS